MKMMGFLETLSVVMASAVGMVTLVGFFVRSSGQTTAAITRLDTTIGQLEKTLERLQADQHDDQLDTLRRMHHAEDKVEDCLTRLKILEVNHGRLHQNP